MWSRPLPISVVNNPLVHSVFEQQDSFGPIAPPGTHFMITETGNHHMITETGELMITE